ncbi:Lactose permease [Colletotrichum orbiculare MAFF 240422]|uniref:Lactose permease n=1 Tax=Colletotrichum orbiculare (strain 104-T / ATCC 96160 / CBS 514.97 / LARS 414 / MAFF 240422) TaxID=1213857 RepID=A0A484F801_COLOR|nr:Lactose permease [Colletotrichum orbiculare MAFF 240422]
MFVAPLIIQKLGRRGMCFIGSVIVMAMATMETFAVSYEMFVAAKLLLGFGSTCFQIAAPVLVTELAPPRQRQRITALYNTFIYIGLILGAWIAYGTRNIPGDRSWQIPCLLQVVLPAYQCCTIFLCPESPRWLVARGREDQARRLLIKHHGGGVETNGVKTEMKEILAGIESDASRMFHKKGICDLLAYKGNQHRLLIATVVAVGPQCCGSGLISAYLPRILDGVGMQSTEGKTMINGIINIWTWVVGIAAGIAIPHVKKRSLFLFSTAGMILTFAIWTALSAIYNERGDKQYGIGVVAMVFVYNFFYGICWLPLVVAYPLELCTTKQRGLFFSWMFFALSMSTFAVNYINPIGLENLQWRYYIIMIAFTTLVFFIIYFSFVETRGLSLEEIATGRFTQKPSGTTIANGVIQSLTVVTTLR